MELPCIMANTVNYNELEGRREGGRKKTEDTGPIKPLRPRESVREPFALMCLLRPRTAQGIFPFLRALILNQEPPLVP